MSKIVDTDGHQYENEEMLLTHVLATVKALFDKYGTVEDVDDFCADELRWWNGEMDRLVNGGCISKSCFERFATFITDEMGRRNVLIAD